MREYSDYKETGIEWLGNVPKEWNVTKLKFLGGAFGGLTYSPQDVVDSESEGLLVLRSSNIQDGHLSLNDNVYVNTRISEKLILRKGDILICSRNGSQRLIGKNICIDDRMAGNTFGAFMMIFRSEGWKFLSHYFNSPIFTSQSALFLTATINQLTSNTLNNFWIAIPNSYKEQIQIAQYLDHKTARFEKLIADKEKLIELLSEERTAIVNRAVTKGINPIAPLKNSGIEWLEEVPEHWEILSFRFCITLLTDFTANGSFASLAENVTYLEQGYSRLIRLTDLRTELTNEGIYVDEKAHNFLKKSELFGGELLVANVGAYAGLVCKMPTIDIKATLGPNMFLLHLNQDTDYFILQMNASFCFEQLKMMSASSAQPKLNKDNIRQLKVIKPPLDEQKAIVEFVRKEDTRISLVLSKVRQEIQLLKEYKTALISEVVTGKVDVRDEVIAKSTELVS